MNELFQKVHSTLPIFKIDNKNQVILYTPGNIMTLKNTVSSGLISMFENPETIENSKTRNAIYEFSKRATEAVKTWEMQGKVPFSPECLTIHVGGECTLCCSYCYSKTLRTINKELVGFPKMNAIERLAHELAKKAKENSGKLSLVYHGAGEPTFHWNQLLVCHERIIEIARIYNIEVFSYIATNGCLSEAQIDWLARNISLIGLSCDGPSEIQEKNRSFNDSSRLSIAQICSRIIKKGGQFDIRVTITPETYFRQVEIVEYLIVECNAMNIRLEPVYLVGDNGFEENTAELFFNHYISAQQYAQKYSVNYSYSGVRMEEQHSTYCDILRNNYRLTSDNCTRNCFCYVLDRTELITGRYYKKGKVYKPSAGLIKLKKKALRIPENCRSCVNIFHCSRGCPDFCIFDIVRTRIDNLNPFRCRFHQILVVEKIKTFVNEIGTTNL